jgi:cobalt-zinc-cadmium efflux system outer membrane protein
MKLRPTRLRLLLCSLLLPAALASGQHEVHPGHLAVETSPGLDFEAVLQATVQHAPQALATTARQEQAAAWRSAGDSWLAGRPSLVYSLYHDRPLDNVGQQEYEWGLQLPLRRLAEFELARRQGEAYTRQAAAWQQSLRWQLAGELRLSLAQLESAEQALQLEQEASRMAEELLTVTQRLFDAGAVARLDLLQAQSLQLTQRQKLLDAEAVLVDAERNYVTLTGLQQRPAAAHREVLADLEEIPDTHPWLGYLRSELGVASSNLRQSEVAAKGSPQLTVGTRRERGDAMSLYNDSVALSFSLPIGGKSHVSAQTSAARMEQADAEVQLHAARRELQRLLHEAGHALHVTRESLPLLQQQAELGEQRSSMARTAFAAGELSLLQVLPTLQEALEARRALLQLQLQEQRQITEYNQIVGVLP